MVEKTESVNRLPGFLNRGFKTKIREVFTLSVWIDRLRQTTASDKGVYSLWRSDSFTGSNMHLSILLEVKG